MTRDYHKVWYGGMKSAVKKWVHPANYFYLYTDFVLTKFIAPSLHKSNAGDREWHHRWTSPWGLSDDWKCSIEYTLLSNQGN